MDIPLDEVVYFDGISSSDTGAAADADSTPTFAVYEEATDTDIGVGGNMTKRTSLTGNYRGSFTASAANGFEVGKWYSVIGSATIGGIACKGVLKSFRIVAAEAVTGKPKVDVDAWLGTAAATPTVAGVPEVDVTHYLGSAAPALVGGRYDASVGAMATDVITNTALAASAVTEIQSGLATDAELAKVPKSDGTVSWNATALAAIQGEATGALNAYDPPTNAEMEARTLVAANYFDPAVDKVFLGDGAHGGTAAVLTLERLIAASTTSNEPAFKLTGNGTGEAILATGGATADAIRAVGGTGNDGIHLQPGAGGLAAHFAGSVTVTGAATISGIVTASNASNNITGIQVRSGGITSSSFASGAITSTVLHSTAISAIQSGLSTHSAADVWAVGTRNLTGLGFTLGSSDFGTDWLTSTGLAASAVSEIQSGLSTLDASGVRSAIGMASASYDSDIAALPTANDNADALLDRSAAIDGYTLRQAMQAIAAKAAGLISGAGTGTEVVKAIGAAAGGTTRLTATVDASGNISAWVINV